MWRPSDPLPDVYPQLAKLSASLSVVVVKAELPASRSWFLLNEGQYALNQHLDSCVKTFMDKTPHCFSSAFCFWKFPDISWIVRLLFVAIAGWRAWGVGISDTNWRGHRAWSLNVYRPCSHPSSSVKMGLMVLGMWPRGLHEKRACGLNVFLSWKLRGTIIKGRGCRAESLGENAGSLSHQHLGGLIDRSLSVTLG